ncbi:hypothetical protein RhiirA4_485828, partial [Rhizophagus irregularis]
EDIGEHLPLDELAKKLYEIELRRIARHKRNRLPDPLFLLEKQKSDFQSQMAQQVSTPQTIEPIRQPRGPPSILKTEEDLRNYYVAEYLKEVGLLSKEDLDSDYPVKNFSKTLFQKEHIGKFFKMQNCRDL